MPSVQPQDFGAVLAPPTLAAPVFRSVLALGQATANTADVKGSGRLLFDRAGVIRELWISADAVPSDADGVITISVKNYDVSEAAADTLVLAADMETIIVAAEKAYKLSLVAETSENERTVAAGDVLRAEITNNSAAIDTNANFFLLVVWQPLASL